MIPHNIKEIEDIINTHTQGKSFSDKEAKLFINTKLKEGYTLTEYTSETAKKYATFTLMKFKFEEEMDLD